MKAILVFLGFAVISLLVATSFNSSFQDELRTQSTYCAMVKEGTWPDYKGIYQTACVGGDDHAD